MVDGNLTPLRGLGRRLPDGVMLVNDVHGAYHDGVEEPLTELFLVESDLRSTNTTLVAKVDGPAQAFQVHAARANIVRGLDIPTTATVLEIGAGCGAVTRYLGERAAVVDAVEPARLRAGTARARTRDLPGVEVFLAEHRDVPPVPTYDVVVVVGVLEYVGGGSADPAPYVDFLAHLASCLLPGGTLVLAIENKLGVKYLVGAPEDHTDRPFTGIEGYPGAAFARTFSRRELEDLARAAGLLPETRVAFPDYKLTRTVMDVPALTEHAPSLLTNLPSFPSPDLRSPRPKLADEALVWRSFVDAGLGAEVGNSLLLLAGKDGPPTLWPAEQAAVYWSKGRAEEHSFTKRVLVRPDGVRMVATSGGSGRGDIRVVLTNEPWVAGRTLVEVVADDPSLAGDALRRWHEALLAETGRTRATLIDFTPNNLVLTPAGELVPIDQEWVTTDWSVDRVVRRAVLWFAAMVARTTHPSRWEGCVTVRDLARLLGTEVGLDEDGAWIERALDEEAAFGSGIAPARPGLDEPGTEVELRAELVSMLADPLASLPLGERLPETFERVRGYLDGAERQAEELRNEVAARRAELGIARGETWEARAEAEALRTQAMALQAEAGHARAVLAEWDQHIRRQATELGRLQAEVAEQRGELVRLTADRDARAAELAAIHASRGYRLVKRAYAAVARVAPPGTRRRRFLGALLRLLLAPVRGLRRLRRAQPAPVVAPPAAPTVADPRAAEAPAPVTGVAPGAEPETVPAGGTAPEPVVLPTSETPRVSVVVPAHGKWPVTEQCLRSFVTHPPSIPFELVVVDDASPDDTRARLTEVGGVVVVALDDNAGFIGATNAGIEAARGEYVVMLNNDTEITPGWLEALVAAVERPGVGLVGSKLVYPTGRLQEAGGIIFDNAGGWNYGRGDDPALPRFNYPREVDYCSGAAIILRRDLLAELGNLDEHFAPAYFDDVDLAFAVRERGLKVVYEPRAVVIHHEGVSHGTDTGSGVKRYQDINREKFVAKWGHRLTEHYPQMPAWVPAAARRLDGRGIVVVIDHHVPRPDEDSGSVRMFGLLTALRRQGWSVVFVPDNRHEGDGWGERLAAEGVEVFAGPEEFEVFYAAIRDRVRAVIAARVTVAWPYLSVVRRQTPRVPFLFDTVDLHHLRERREAELADDPALLARSETTRKLELGLVTAADATLVVSPFEVDLLAREAPGATVAVVPNVHERLPEGPGPRARAGVAFVGSFAHPPNIDAVRWLLTDVLPLVRREVPDAVFHIVGRGLPDDVAAMADDGVVVHGWLPSLDELYATVRVSIAPLRYGAGIKGKVGEAVSHGVPVVATRVAAEGMHLEHQVSGWIADEPAGLAEGVVALLRDDALWTRMSSAGRDLVEETLGVARFEALLAEALERAGVRPRDEG